MTTDRTKSLAAALCLSLASLGASAQQLILSPSNVIGSSGFAGVTYEPGNLLDQQTGTVTDNFGDYWLSPTNADASNTFITIDLGAAYPVDLLVLFNTHHSFNYNRGTGNFRVVASNSVVDLGGSNFALSGTTSVLVQGTLGAVWGDNPPAVTFDVTDPTPYRFLSFQPLTVASAIAPPTPTSFGMNEMRVVVSAVPEASTSAMMLAGVAVVGWLVARRRRPG
jgi:hypothetical protein